MNDQLSKTIPMSDADRILSESLPSPVVAEPVLCYATDTWLFFTDLPLAEQDGKDWGMAYERNTWEMPDPDAQITRIAFAADLVRPIDLLENCRWYNVRHDMNHEKRLPWLSSPMEAKHSLKLWAGMTMSEVILAIHSIGGTVYTLLKKEEDPYGRR